ncbi:iron(III) ABC transporter [Stutzerimonas stutzeri]|uniref:Iron(III) ABC transporter n=1 Tax=Stutzerimonas stutzeri TaxID=316 RepID=A0A2S4AHC3_STUST|nr:ChaN family lipoprotein [Stutzerimonas stutzeri]MCQ4265200.1 ChaN family lipoprotein [Stutzerimonas stutzeri]POH80863.1 iron(III) ABC transporter [Stutzerimonas stutzeri]
MRIIVLLVLGLLAGCHSLPPLPEWQSPEGRAHPDLGLIVDLRRNAVLGPAQLVAQLQIYDGLLVGERHDNPDHHALQLWLLRALEGERPQGSLLLEMLEPDQQPRVDAVRREMRDRREPADLPKALGWQKGWDWSLYGALVSHALAQSYPLLHANLGRDEIMSIYRSVPPLQGRASATPGVSNALLAQIEVSHCGMLPASQLPAMLAVQQQRDRRMAEQMVAAPKPAMLLAGAFHVRRDLGVPLHIADLSGERVGVLMLAEVGETVTAAQADYVWYTAAQPEQDHCEQLRQHGK